jgi:hypothetical protein
MPVLTALDIWDWKFPAYASMIIVETYDMSAADGSGDFPSGYAFRIVYNGRVLTGKFSTCAKDVELCDLDVLLSYLDAFAKPEHFCDPTARMDTNSDDDTDGSKGSRNNDPLAVGSWVGILLLVSAASVLLGRSTVQLIPVANSPPRDGNGTFEQLGDVDDADFKVGIGVDNGEVEEGNDTSNWEIGRLSG